MACRCYPTQQLWSTDGRAPVTATDKEIRSLDFVKGKASGRATALAPALRACLKQLDEYFAGRRRIFQLMLRLEGSEFQCDVWQALLDRGAQHVRLSHGLAARVLPASDGEGAAALTAAARG